MTVWTLRRATDRRAFLRVGALGAGCLTLPALLEAGARAGEPTDAGFGRAKRCLLVYLNGGPSQLDLWDMKPAAPAEVRGPLRPIATDVPGIRVSELLPLTAQHVDKLKIVRSVTHNAPVHTTALYTMLTGTLHATPGLDQTRTTPQDHPHFGAIYAYRHGWHQGLPPFVSLPMLFQAPPVEGVWPGQTAGFLGKRYDPLVIRGDKQTAAFALPEVQLPSDLTGPRLDARRELLGRFERAMAAAERAAHRGGLDPFQEQAFALIQSPGLHRALDLEREPPGVRDHYGHHLFGQGLLLARRLLEAGVPLVTVYWIDPTPAGDGGGEYDSHGRIYHHYPHRLLPATDRALASLFADLAARGLLAETLVLVMGEFGRTPRLNAQAGRDHWPQVQSILLAGAGITGGSLYGASDRLAAYPAENPVPAPDLLQTVLHLLGVPADLELHDPLGRPVLACAGRYLPGLVA
jgi:hypothetical protein